MWVSVVDSPFDSHRDLTGLPSESDQLGVRMHIKLAVDLLQMRPHRVGANEELSCDGFAADAAGSQKEHVHLPGRQTLEFDESLVATASAIDKLPEEGSEQMCWDVRTAVGHGSDGLDHFVRARIRRDETPTPQFNTRCQQVVGSHNHRWDPLHKRGQARIDVGSDLVPHNQVWGWVAQICAHAGNLHIEVLERSSESRSENRVIRTDPNSLVVIASHARSLAVSKLLRGEMDPWRPGNTQSQFLIDLAAGRPSEGGLEPSNELLHLANAHGLIGLFADWTDDPIVRANMVRLAARQQMMRHHLSRVLQRFHQAGVRAAVIKGPRLADAFYRDAHHRTFTDIDVLVEPDSLERALELLSRDEAVSAVPKRGPKADKRDVLFSDPSGITFILDLHWNLFSYRQLRGTAGKATNAAWESAIWVEDSSVGPHWTLPIGTEIAFLAAHSILDHRFRLALFRDFVEIARRKVDWDDVIATSGRWGLRSTTYIPLWIAREALGAEVPEGVLESLRPRSMVVSFLERTLPRVDLAEFDGHRVHPVNLAVVLLNDSPAARVGLAFRAPFAFPAWRRRAMDSPDEVSRPRQ